MQTKQIIEQKKITSQQIAASIAWTGNITKTSKRVWCFFVLNKSVCNKFNGSRWWLKLKKIESREKARSEIFQLIDENKTKKNKTNVWHERGKLRSQLCLKYSQAILILCWTTFFSRISPWERRFSSTFFDFSLVVLFIIRSFVLAKVSEQLFFRVDLLLFIESFFLSLSLYRHHIFIEWMDVLCVCVC